MIFQELIDRGLVKQTTNADKIRDLLDNQQITFYIGFDPTADSLHVGHLLQLVTAKRLAQAGHRPIMLIGDATALVGDPTGKTDMRKMLSRDNIHAHSEEIEKQIRKIVDPQIIDRHFVVHNSSWFKDMNFLSFIRDTGQHFSVNNMLRAECFKSRMEHGLSFLEFSYMLMQAFDFFRLNTSGLDCRLQIGGDDQWSNILAGIDLIHKKTGKEAFGLTLPLLVNSDGTKMGKTEKGAVWLDPKKTSPFEFFQFWRNIPDDKVKECINFFTDEINSEDSILLNINQHKKFLAFEVTKLVHGEQLARQSLEQAEALFEKQDASTIETISIMEGTHILDLIIKCGFAKSRTDARNLINNRGITINEEVQTNPTINISKSIFGNELIVKKGKKHFCRLLIEDKCQDQNP